MKQRTRKNTRSSNKSRRRHHRRLKPCNSKNNLVENFIEMLNTIKLYHWNTHSYAQHKASDELYEKLSDHVDKFVEILLGKDATRISRVSFSFKMHPRTHMDTKMCKTFIYHYREYLIQMDKCFDAKKDSDILNIRDEILGDLNQFLYLLSLSK